MCSTRQVISSNSSHDRTCDGKGWIDSSLTSYSSDCSSLGVIGDVGGGQAHGVLALPLTDRFDCPQHPVVGDVLHEPQLPVRHTQGGVVLMDLDQVTSPDAGAIVVGRGRLVVYGSSVHALVADARVETGRPRRSWRR